MACKAYTYIIDLWLHNECRITKCTHINGLALCSLLGLCDAAFKTCSVHVSST